MKIAMWGLAALILMAGPCAAEDLTKESGKIFGSMLTLIVKWVFPVCAAYCFLHGVIGKGVKRGEWDMAAICTLAAVALALFPKLLEKLFGVNL
jgi:hypothetical protein